MVHNPLYDLPPEELPEGECPADTCPFDVEGAQMPNSCDECVACGYYKMYDKVDDETPQNEGVPDYPFDVWHDEHGL